MDKIGSIESVWRYPVKGMRGEELESAFAGFAGVYGDRVYAFVDPGAASKGFPFLTPRGKAAMIRYQPVFRNAELMSQPPNLKEAENLGPGITPIYADPADSMVDVTPWPDGDALPIDSTELIAHLSDGLGDGHRDLKLIRSDRALTDCRPISLFSVHSVARLGPEVGSSPDLVDARRYRANFYFSLFEGQGYEEKAWIGRTMRIGDKCVVTVVDPIPRCKMITLDPETTAANPDVARNVNQNHNGKAGVYAAVVVEGTIRKGDAIWM